ncbi:MAG: GWxTD domain-containing protein [Candidatus Aminicenantales bacterium]
MRKEIQCWLGVLFCLLWFSSCTGLREGSRLDPLAEDFLSRVRYIITKEETKIFRELPPSARPRFIEEFWTRRDPTPETETNEYKEAYFERIAEANRLFRGGQPGWLQDRGRIYILFGPPDERQTNPMGGRTIDPYLSPTDNLQGQRIATGEKPTEVWVYYNLFTSLQQPHSVKLVFVDSQGTGNYSLTSDLDEILPGGIHTFFEPDLVFTHELSKEEAERTKLRSKRVLFDFVWEFLPSKNRALGSNLSIRVAIPSRKIIFRGEVGRLVASLELTIRILDGVDQVLWEKTEIYDLDYSQSFIVQNKDGVWETVVPVTRWLGRGKYSVYLSLKNPGGDQWVEKLLPLRM